MGRASRVETFVRQTEGCRHLRACWDFLGAHLAELGFDRLLYGSGLRLASELHHNLADVIVLSTYPRELMGPLLEKRLFVHDAMFRWVMRNTGAKSWSYARERYASVDISRDERAFFEMANLAGVSAGYVYAFPSKKNGLKSAFGLCYRAGHAQDHVDAVWDAFGAEIIALLNVFELSAGALPSHAPEEALSPRQTEVLRLAAEGRTISEIAELLGLHRRTVDDHMTKARETLGVGSTLQAAVRATKQRQI